MGAAFGAVSGLGGDAIGQVARVEGFHDGGYSLPELGSAVVVGGATGGLLEGAGGVLGKLGRLRGGRGTPRVGGDRPPVTGLRPGETPGTDGVRTAPYRDAQHMLTDGRYRVSAAKQAKHVYETASPGKSTFTPGRDTEELALDAARRADGEGLWRSSNPEHPSGAFPNKAKVVYDEPIGTHHRSRLPTSVVNVYRTTKGTIHISPGSPR